MSAGKEALVTATVARSLKWNANEECAVDKLAAMAWAKEPLGSAIVHAIANDALSRRTACDIVARKIRRACDKANLTAALVASVVLADVIDTQCKPCGGRGIVNNDKVVSTCTHCQGTRLRDTRAKERKVGNKKIPDNLYSEAYQLFANALDRIQNRAKYWLRND